MKNKHGLKIVLSIASIGIMFVGLYQFVFASTFGSFQSDQSTKMSNSTSIIETTPNLVQTSAVTKSEITFTASELARYDGMNGNPAYVAVDGIIYDMTKIGAWKNGQHQGLSAGQDLSAAFAGSPHSKNILDQSPIVGKLVTSKAPVTGNTTSKATPTTVTKPQTWTLDALSKFNGMNGNPAYIAVSGTIYDVTKIGAWSGGEHRGIKAGQDVTTFFASSPHSASLLNQVPIVGKVGGTISSNPVDTTTSATTSNLNSNSNSNQSENDDEYYEDENEYEDEDNDEEDDENEDEYEDEDEDDDEDEDGDD